MSLTERNRFLSFAPPSRGCLLVAVDIVSSAQHIVLCHGSSDDDGKSFRYLIAHLARAGNLILRSEPLRSLVPSTASVLNAQSSSADIVRIMPTSMIGHLKFGFPPPIRLRHSLNWALPSYSFIFQNMLAT